MHRTIQWLGEDLGTWKTNALRPLLTPESGKVQEPKNNQVLWLFTLDC